MKIIKSILLAFILCLACVSVADDVQAASIVKQSGNVFGQPQKVSDGVKLSLSGTVKFIRHTKYNEATFGFAVAHKQLQARTSFTATKYNCPGYYISRAYSDSAGSNLIGYVYVKVDNADISNTKCEPVDTSDAAVTPAGSINATHPIAHTNEKSKMVKLTENVSPSNPVTISNPETIKTSDKSTVIEPTQAELDEFFAREDDYDACLDNFNAIRPAYMAPPGTNDYECVETSNCYYTAWQHEWYCQPTAKNYEDRIEPQPTTIYYDIPEYELYDKHVCSDNDTSEACTVFESVVDGVPTGATEMSNVEPEEETEQPTPTMTIAACKGEYKAYSLLVDGVYQVPWEYKESDIKATNAEVTLDVINRAVITLDGSNVTVQLANSNVLTDADFANAQPCPTDAPPPVTPEVSNRLRLSACIVPGTQNQFDLKIEFDAAGDGNYLPIKLQKMDGWYQYPSESAVTWLSGNRPNGSGGNILIDTFVINSNEPFAFEGFTYWQGVDYTSNVLTSDQITSECSTTGNITDPGEPPVDSGNETSQPDCYCPELENLGAGLGYLCCVWECPGLNEIISEGEQFLMDDLVGQATAPPVPEFEPAPMPNIFDILNGVDAKNQPDAPTGENAPGLEDAGFTADDVNEAAPEIEFKEDTTGGFNIIDPVSNLPDDGSTAPRPKESTAEKPDLSGGSSDYNGTATPPSYNGGSVSTPTTNESASPPTAEGTLKTPQLNGN